MTDEQRIAVTAKACGWKQKDIDTWQDALRAKTQFECGEIREPEYYRRYLRRDLPPERLPAYLDDLNAMHEAEDFLTIDEKITYVSYLNSIYPKVFGCIHSTARDRNEAFLRVKNLWVE